MANTGPPVDSGGGPMWIPIAPHRTATGAGGSHDRQTRPESNCGTCTDPSNPNSPRRPMVAAESNYSTEFVPLPVIPCYPKELLNLSEQISSFSETLKQVVAQQESSKAENCQILKQMKIMDQNQADRLNALDAKLDKLLGIQTPETTPFIKFGRGKYPRKKKMFPVIEHASKVAVKAREELPVTRRELPDRAAKHIAPSNEDRSRSRRPRKSRNDLPSYKEVDPDDEQPTSEEPSEKMSHVLNCSELHPEASHTTRSNPETNKQNELPIEEQMEIQTTTPSFETLQLIKNTSVDNGDSRIYTDDGKSEDSLTSADREHQKTETPQINICNLESNGKEIKSTNDTISTSHEQQVTGSNCSDIMDSVEKDFNQSASDSPAQKELACSEPIKQCSEEHRLERNYSPILTTEESVDRSPVEKPVSNVSCLLEEKLVEKVTSYKEPNKTAAVTELIEGSVVKSSDSKGLSTRSRNCSTKDINGFDGNRVTENLTQDSGDSSMPMDVTRDKESTIISKIYEDAIGISQYQQPIPSVLQDSEPAENVVLDLTVDITEPLLGSDSKRLETTVAPVSLNNSNPDKLPEHHEPIDSPTDQPNERAPEVQSLNVSRSPSVLLLETSTDIEKSFLKPCDQLFKDHDQEPASNASGDLETTTEQVNIMEELSTSEGDKILDDSVPMNSILGSLEAENSLALDDEQNSDISGSKPPNTEICTAIQEIISSMLQKLEEDSTQRTDDSQALENNAEGLLTATTDNQQGDISEVGPTANKERVDLEDYELPVYGFERLPHFLLPQDPSQRIRMPKNMTRELKRTDRDQSEFAEHFFPENVLEQEQIPDEVDPTLNNQEMLDEFLEQQNEAFGDHEDFLVVPKSTARVQHLVPPVNSVRRRRKSNRRKSTDVGFVAPAFTAQEEAKVIVSWRIFEPSDTVQNFETHEPGMSFHEPLPNPVAGYNGDEVLMIPMVNSLINDNYLEYNEPVYNNIHALPPYRPPFVHSSWMEEASVPAISVPQYTTSQQTAPLDLSIQAPAVNPYASTPEDASVPLNPTGQNYYLDNFPSSKNIYATVPKPQPTGRAIKLAEQRKRRRVEKTVVSADTLVTVKEKREKAKTVRRGKPRNDPNLETRKRGPKTTKTTAPRKKAKISGDVLDSLTLQSTPSGAPQLSNEPTGNDAVAEKGYRTDIPLPLVIDNTPIQSDTPTDNDPPMNISEVPQFDFLLSISINDNPVGVHESNQSERIDVLSDSSFSNVLAEDEQGKLRNGFEKGVIPTESVNPVAQNSSAISSPNSELVPPLPSFLNAFQSLASSLILRSTTEVSTDTIDLSRSHVVPSRSSTPSVSSDSSVSGVSPRFHAPKKRTRSKEVKPRPNRKPVSSSRSTSTDRPLAGSVNARNSHVSSETNVSSNLPEFPNDSRPINGDEVLAKSEHFNDRERQEFKNIQVAAEKSRVERKLAIILSAKGSNRTETTPPTPETPPAPVAPIVPPTTDESPIRSEKQKRRRKSRKPFTPDESMEEAPKRTRKRRPTKSETCSQTSELQLRETSVEL